MEHNAKRLALMEEVAFTYSFTSEQSEMPLLNLPLEVFEEVIAALTNKVGQRSVVQYRLISSKYYTGVKLSDLNKKQEHSQIQSRTKSLQPSIPRTSPNSCTTLPPLVFSKSMVARSFTSSL